LVDHTAPVRIRNAAEIPARMRATFSNAILTVSAPCFGDTYQ
jgi:hypothetical protein